MSHNNWKKSEDVREEISTQPPVSLPTVLSAINMLENELQELSDVIDHLGSKLGPVLCEPENKPCCEDVVREGTSPMSVKLWNLVVMTGDLIVSCNRLMERLEI